MEYISLSSKRTMNATHLVFNTDRSVMNIKNIEAFQDSIRVHLPETQTYGPTTRRQDNTK